MRKLLQLTKVLLVAAALGMGATSAWAETTIGATDNTTAYLGAKSEAYDISENGTWTFNFTNYNAGTGGNWDNWILECSYGTKDFFVLRADRFETVSWSNNNTVWGDESAWTDFVSKMNGATVVMTVTRENQHISVSTTTTPSTGDPFTYSYDYYKAIGDLSLYLSVSNSHLTIQSASWSAADTKAVTILSQDYESYTADADIKTNLQSAGWTFQTATGCTLNAIAKQETLNEDPSVVNKFARFNYTGSRAHRWQRWDFGAESSLNADNWTLSFDATLTSSTTAGTACLAIAGASTGGITTASSDCTNPIFMIANGGNTNPTTYSATIGASSVGSSFTLAAGTWYRYTIKVSSIDTENNTATVSVSIDQQDGTNVFSATQTGISTTAIGTLRGIAWYAIKGGSWLYLDNVILTKDVSTAVCANPTWQSTGANGASRKFTLACETGGSTIYYAFSSLEKGAAGWSAYSSEITTSEGTIYAYAQKGSATSDIVSFSTEVDGNSVQLVAPVITRSSANTVTITADQSSLGFDVSPVATIYYTYGGDATEYTGAITVSADATLSAYAVLDGYTTSETASRAVAPAPTASTMVQVENATSITSGNADTAFSDQTTTVSDVTYAALLVGDVQWGENVYFETTTDKWGFRTTGDWYVQGTAKLLMKSMKAGDIIYVKSNYQASSLTNVTYSEKYTYSNMFAYTVDEDGDVIVALTKPTSMHYFYGVYAYSRYVNVTVSDAGMATYVPTYDLDFSATAIKAYKAKVTEQGVCKLTEVPNVPAGTPVLLIKDGGATEAIPVMTGAATVSGNDLVAGTGAAVATTDGAGNTNMILNNGTSGVGFYFANGKTVATNRAYLHFASSYAPSASAPMMLVFADDVVTGINTVNGSAVKINGSEGVYNLSGQRVVKPTRGLYIVNGKKVVVK